MTTDFEPGDEAPQDVDQGAHLDGFRVVEDDDQEGRAEFVDVGEDGEPVADLIEPEQMSKAAFHKVFTTAFALPGMIFPRWRPLAIQDDEEHAAREASDAIYEILEIWWPGALLPGGDMAARVLAILPLALAKAAVVAAIRAEAKAERLAKAEPPANANRPPRAEAAPQPPAEAATGGHEWMDQENAA